nr:beta-xylosidase [Rhodococcus sp. (in: high G+C Gram-positive bacteria)]
MSSAPRIGGSPGATLGALSNADLDHELTLASNAGMFGVRVDIDWSGIEAVRGRFDWSNTDRVLAAVVSHGMCPLGIIGYTPAWARVAAAAGDSHSRPADPNTYAGFVGTVVQRYRDHMNLWEVWNEPNIVGFFKPQPDVAAYSLMLRAAYQKIKALQPNSTVLSGGLAPATNNGVNIDPTTYLQQMYQLGANAYFDGFNLHPYTYPALPNDPSTSSWNTAMKLWPMHDIMVAGGDSAKQIWLTEFGAPTGTASTAVSEQGQADTIGIIMDAVLGNSWIGPAFVYSTRDAGTNLADPEQNFGLLRRDFSPKLAYGRVLDFTSGHPAA